jgi:predicted membrane protein
MQRKPKENPKNKNFCILLFFSFMCCGFFLLYLFFCSFIFSFIFGECKENQRKTKKNKKTKESKSKNPKNLQKNKKKQKNHKNQSLREIGTADIEESLVWFVF